VPEDKCPGARHVVLFEHQSYLGDGCGCWLVFEEVHPEEEHSAMAATGSHVLLIDLKRPVLNNESRDDVQGNTASHCADEYDDADDIPDREADGAAIVAVC
jgi:hypothetical protein